MSASSAASSSLTRTTKTSIALFTILCAYGIYLYYTDEELETLPEQTDGSGPPLRRRNATRQRRVPSATQVQTAVVSDEDAEIVAHSLADGETVVDETYEDEYSWDDLPRTYERSGQNIVQLLFKVTEDATRRNSYVHRGCACNGCGSVPIRGVRYRCANCADYDLCESCEAQGLHTKTHIFYKVKVPAPAFGSRHVMPVLYTGDPEDEYARKPLPKLLIEKLTRETGFERPEIDAYWEQWTFMANVPWREDPDDANLAMDKKTFERCLVPSGAYSHATPNIIYDRMFAFYDTNKDRLIGFSEFVNGLAYRKKKDRWRKIFEGYDIDEDGYVERKDFLRIFRAYYVLYRQMSRDMLEGLDDQQMSSTRAHKIINSRKPLSSAFGEFGEYVRYPQSDPRTRVGSEKIIQANGDTEIMDGQGVTLASSNDTTSTLNRESIVRNYGKKLEPMRRYYWDAMMNPYTPIELPDILKDRGITHPPPNRLLSDSDSGDISIPFSNDDEWPPKFVNIEDEDIEKAGWPNTWLEHVPKENRRDVVIRALHREKIETELHDRWRRRRFYTEEEEGVVPPKDWQESEDILINLEKLHDRSKDPSTPSPTEDESPDAYYYVPDDLKDKESFDRKKSKMMSAREFRNDRDTRISEPERDAGKEVLYQVTQQAYNELLDSLFLAQEDIAIEVARQKSDLKKFKHLYSTPEIESLIKEMEASEEIPAKVSKKVKKTRRRKSSEQASEETLTFTQNPVWPDVPPGVDPAELGIDELLDATGYHVATPVAQSPPMRGRTNYYDGSIPNTNVYDRTPSPTRSGQADVPSHQSPEYQDPTMPQFRPSTLPESEDFDGQDRNVVSDLPSDSSDVHEPPPSQDFLVTLWKLNKAMDEANDRGGWGRISWEEFEVAIRSHDSPRGNRMDYLGSWIEFCIP